MAGRPGCREQRQDTRLFSPSFNGRVRPDDKQQMRRLLYGGLHVHSPERRKKKNLLKLTVVPEEKKHLHSGSRSMAASRAAYESVWRVVGMGMGDYR